MKQSNRVRRLAAGLLGAAVFALAGCSVGSGTEADLSGLFAVHPMSGYEQSDGRFNIRDDSGQTVAVLEADDVLGSFPARSTVEAGDESEFPTTLWGAAPDGTQWVVVWSGPSAGVSQCRVLLSGDGGETWSPTSTDPSPVSDVYGAGFLNDQVGFVCSRHFQTTGPEIFWTQDGGASWSLLELPIPEEYQGSVMDAYGPQIQDGEVRFPVMVWGETSEKNRYVFCTSTDLEHWTWSENG